MSSTSWGSRFDLYAGGQQTWRVRSKEGLAYFDDLLEQLEDDAIETGVLEASLVGLGQRSADGESNDNIIGVLLCAVVDCQSSPRGS